MSRTRDVSWIMQKFRGMLLGREWNRSQLRFKQNISSRSPPHPMIPGKFLDSSNSDYILILSNDISPHLSSLDGSAHKLSDNAYVKRDTRRLVTPPKDYVNVLHNEKQIEAKVGKSLMSAALAAGIEIEAACDGNCACSTCHVYIDKEHFDKLEPASDEEEDMLDLALFVQPNSRLSCQIIISHDHEGLSFGLPSATRNFYAGKEKKT